MTDDGHYSRSNTLPFIGAYHLGIVIVPVLNGLIWGCIHTFLSRGKYVKKN